MNIFKNIMTAVFCLVSLSASAGWDILAVDTNSGAINHPVVWTNAVDPTWRANSNSVVAGATLGTTAVQPDGTSYGSTWCIGVDGTRTRVVTENGTNYLDVVTKSKNVRVTATRNDGMGYNGPAVGVTWTNPVVNDTLYVWDTSSGFDLHSELNFSAFVVSQGDDKWICEEASLLPADTSGLNGAALGIVSLDWVVVTNRYLVVDSRDLSNYVLTSNISSRTSIWNQASTDGITATGRLVGVEGRTSTWNTVAANAITNNNGSVVVLNTNLTVLGILTASNLMYVRQGSATDGLTVFGNGARAASYLRMFVDANGIPNMQNDSQQIRFNCALFPAANAAFDIGTSGLAWRDLYLTRDAFVSGRVQGTGVATFFTNVTVAGSLTVSNGVVFGNVTNKFWGVTTNLAVLTTLPSTFSTLVFTNGVLMAVQ